MTIRYDGHWSGRPITAEVLAVDPRPYGVMLQTTKGPISLDRGTSVTVIKS